MKLINNRVLEPKLVTFDLWLHLDVSDHIHGTASRETAEQDDGILLLIDAQTGPAPLEPVAVARDQIFKEFDAPARAPHCRQGKSHILKRHASRLRSEYGSLTRPHQACH
jgi:hypothetical protein